MQFQRMLDKEKNPTNDDIISTVGEKSPLWIEINKFIEARYEILPEIVFYGKKYGWTLRYRKSGKTLCSFFPEINSFSVLIVLGSKEVDKLLQEIQNLNLRTRSVFENTEQLHDGRWLWLRVFDVEDIKSIKLILSIKRNPKKLN